MKNKNILKLVVSAMLLALAYVLPFLTTGNNPIIASSLSPIHIPVLLCGFLCGWQYGLAVGCLAPLLRFVTIHMPQTIVQAVAMSCELATYGAVSGLLYRVFGKQLKQKGIAAIYPSLIGAMLAGRIVWGIVTYALTAAGAPLGNFLVEVFIVKEFTNQVPALILHLILVPVILLALRRAGVLRELED